MDDGYPEEEDIEYLKEQLNTFDFDKGAEVIMKLITATEYGRCDYIKGDTINVMTGGWSGCEEILQEAIFTVWYQKYWKSTHRGGLFVFGKD